MSADEMDDMPDASEADLERWARDEEYMHTDDDNPNPRVGRVCQIGDHVELSRFLVTDLGGPENLVYDELHAWRYDEASGLWPKVDGAEESRIVQSYSGTPKLPNGAPLRVKASDVAGAIKLAHDQIARPDFFGDVSCIAFSDCVVRLTPAGLEVLPHAREHRVRAGYPFPYEPRALPRRFLAFLSEVFRDDADRCEKELLVQEFFGACIFGSATRYQKALLAFGPTADNGKSTLSKTIVACMPSGTTSAIPPQHWGHEYYRALLIGKLLNAVNELPDGEIIASESFKAIVTGDDVVGRVIRERPEMIRPKAGHYFATNKLPGTTDQTEGFWRRFIVLTFNRSFTNDPSRDPDLDVKLLEERPKIVSWLLDGAARLVREKAYTIPSSHTAAVREWRKSADQVALFVDAELRPLRNHEDVGTGLFAAEMYGTYRRWTETNGHRAMASNKFGSRMRELGHAPTKTKTGWRYLLVPKTAAERAGVTDGDGQVTDYPSPRNREVSRA